MSIHGPIKTSKLTEEERQEVIKKLSRSYQEVIKKYGKPTYPLNHFRSRFYMGDPTKKRNDCGGFKEGVKF